MDKQTLVISKQVWDEHIKTCEKIIANARKETAEKFAEKLKEEIADFDELRCIQVFEFIDEICKEISEGK